MCASCDASDLYVPMREFFCPVISAERRARYAGTNAKHPITDPDDVTAERAALARLSAGERAVEAGL